MVFGGFGSVNLRRHISFSRGRVRMQRSWISVSDWESQAGCEPPEVNSPRPAPWLSPSIFQGALEGDNKWKFKKFPTECFWSVHQGNRKLCTSQVCVSSLWMCSLRLARSNLLTALLRLKEKKKSQRRVFLKYSGLSSAFLNDSVVPGFHLPLLPTAGSGGGEVVFGMSLNQLRGSDCDQGPRFPVGICSTSLKFDPLKPES